MSNRLHIFGDAPTDFPIDGSFLRYSVVSSQGNHPTAEEILSALEPALSEGERVIYATPDQSMCGNITEVHDAFQVIREAGYTYHDACFFNTRTISCSYQAIIFDALQEASQLIELGIPVDRFVNDESSTPKHYAPPPASQADRFHGYFLEFLKREHFFYRQIFTIANFKTIREAAPHFAPEKVQKKPFAYPVIHFFPAPELEQADRYSQKSRLNFAAYPHQGLRSNRELARDIASRIASADEAIWLAYASPKASRRVCSLVSELGAALPFAVVHCPGEPTLSPRWTSLLGPTAIAIGFRGRSM